MHRIFDICHGCRRCFNLCDSFPRLFDLIDASATGEVDGVDAADYGKVVEACTLCDMCFMTKCPYVPPHPWAVDFPHLMLRYRAADFRDGKLAWSQRQLVETDRNGTLAGKVAPLANWASKTGNALTRPAMEKLLGIDRRAALPKFHGRSFALRANRQRPSATRPRPGITARRCSTPPASSTTTTRASARRRAPCSRTTASRPRWPIPAAAACRSSSRATSRASPSMRARSPRRSAPISTRATTWWR